MITIAEALLKEADSQVHAAYLAAVGKILASAAYSPANDRTLSRMRSNLQQAHLQHCERLLAASYGALASLIGTPLTGSF